MTEGPPRYGGRYEITSALASGGMAEVFLARDELLGRQVALKVLHPEFARDKTFIERFRREAQAAASLNDPRIVSVFDWGSDDGTYYLVMEYVEGKTLRDVIRSEGPLTIERSLEIASDVCMALHYAHGNGIVHRDVKPANIAITPGGQTKVMDFGIARAASDAGQTMTQTGTVMGTANYLSPEQAQGTPVDARSDVYSLGVVLYEMLTQEVPFQADTAVAIAYKHVKEDPVPPSMLNAEIPQEVDAVVMKALAKNPDNRYQSASEMRSDLQRVLRGQPVSATPVMPAEQTAMMQSSDRTTVMPVPTVPESSRRRRALAYTLITLLFLSIIVGLVALLFSLFAPGGEPVEIPDVTGLAFTDAEHQLEGAGLKARLADREFHDSVPEGSVISQDPEGGRKEPEGTVIDLVVSQGPQTIGIPDVVGKTEEEARSLITDAGFVVGNVTRAFSDEVPQDSVISQSPEAGERVPRESRVDLVVSGGRNTVSVPEVTGIDEQRAREIILERGLNPVVVEVCNTTRRNNTVMDQSPAPREQVAEGSDVTITVNKAPSVPGVRGDTEEEATDALQLAGFRVRVVEQEALPPNEGRVLDQDPSSGTTACRGDVVTITVGR